MADRDSQQYWGSQLAQSISGYLSTFVNAYAEPRIAVLERRRYALPLTKASYNRSN